MGTAFEMAFFVLDYTIDVARGKNQIPAMILLILF